MFIEISNYFQVYEIKSRLIFLMLGAKPRVSNIPEKCCFLTIVLETSALEMVYELNMGLCVCVCTCVCISVCVQLIAKSQDSA